MKDHISKRLVLRFDNKFTKQLIFVVEMPYLPFLATNGYYSDLYKRFKKAAAFDYESFLVVGKKWFEESKSKRTVYTFYSGVSLDVPFDLNKEDIRIINHYLEGLKMSCKK